MQCLFICCIAACRTLNSRFTARGWVQGASCHSRSQSVGARRWMSAGTCRSLRKRTEWSSAYVNKAEFCPDRGEVIDFFFPALQRKKIYRFS